MVDLLRIKAVRLRVCVHPSVSSLCYHFVSVCMSGCLCLFVSLSLSLFLCLHILCLHVSLSSNVGATSKSMKKVILKLHTESLKHKHDQYLL